MAITEPKLKLLRTELLVGLFFLSALAALAIFTIVLNPDLLGKQTWPLDAQFTEIGSLKAGDNVKLKGVPFGKVKAIEISDDLQTVQVHMTLLKEPRLNQDCKIRIASSSVLGGQYVDIDPGAPASGKRDTSILIGEPPMDLLKDASELVAALKADEEMFRKSLEEGGVLKKIQNTVDNLDTFSSNAKLVSEQIAAGTGTLGRLVMKDDIIGDVKKDIKESLANFASSGDKIGAAADSIKTLGEDGRKFVDEAKQFIAQARDGEGTLAKLLKDDSIHQNLLEASENVKEFSLVLDNKDNSIIRLMTDKGKLYSELENSFKNLKEVTGKINDGKGTLGKLINEDGIYDETKAVFDDARIVLKEVKLALKDLREQAPINTFGSVLFGAL